MGEPVYAFVVDGERVGLTERQYGERLARAARIETAAYHQAYPALRSPSRVPRRGEMDEPHFKIVDVLRKSDAPMLPCEIAAALGFSPQQVGHRVRICCQRGFAIKRVTGKKTVRYEAAPIDE